MLNEIPTAVCVLLYNNEGKVLAVSRKNDATQWGLPGGKVDPGESNREAAIREIFEETAIKLNPLILERFYNDECQGNNEDLYEVTTYFYPIPVTQDIITEKGILSNFVWLEFLCDDKNSPFAEYNTKILNFLKRNLE